MRGPKRLPTRLLKLTESGKTPQVELVETAHMGMQDLDFATLSHCWGDTLMVKLLQSSLDSFKLNIKWSDLPKTFQETILVALRLNIHWLWIDALCIIQDDNDDWLREAASMVKFIPARNSASLQTPRKMARKAFSAKGTRNSDDRSTFRTVKAQHRLHGP